MTPFSDIAIRQLLDATIQTLPLDRKLTAELGTIEQDGAVEAVLALDPQDITEAMLAGRAVVAHFAAMACFRCAGHPETSDAKAMRFLDKAVVLSNVSLDMQKALRQRQAIGRRMKPVASLPPPAALHRSAVVAPEPPPPDTMPLYPPLTLDGPAPGTTIH
jgi:hypothetical protein